MSIFGDDDDDNESIFDRVQDVQYEAFNLEMDTTGIILQNTQNQPKIDEVGDLQKQQQQLISQYRTAQSETAVWVTPINQTANITTSILQKTSDYVQGIKFCYKDVLNSESDGVALVDDIQILAITPPDPNRLSEQEAHSSEVAFVTGNITEALDSALQSKVDEGTELSNQIDELTDQNNQLTQAVQDEETLKANLMILKQYLLELNSQAINIYQTSANVSFGLDLGFIKVGLDRVLPFIASPEILNLANEQIGAFRDKLEGINGNTFMIYRVLINLIQREQIIGNGTDEQLDYLTKVLYDIPSVAQAFTSPADVKSLITRFLQKDQLAVVPLFLQLPPVPDAIKSLVSLSPSQKEQFDLYSDKYDTPGDFDLSDFPS